MRLGLYVGEKRRKLRVAYIAIFTNIHALLYCYVGGVIGGTDEGNEQYSNVQGGAILLGS